MAQTVHEIANTLLKPQGEAADAQNNSDEQADEVVLEEPGNDNTLDEGNFDGVVPDEDDQNLDVDADADDEDGQEEEAGEDEGESLVDEFFEVSDDDMIEVTIDGETVLKSIADAKKALSGEGAYEKRIQEATELRKQAQAEYTQHLETLRTANETFANVVQELENTVFNPTKPKPDASLKQSNPRLYQQQLAEHFEEQEAFEQGRQVFQQLVQKQKAALEQQKQQYLAAQSAELERKLPVLSDPQKAKQTITAMQETARHYGFTDEEIMQAMDHRYYLMVADLAKYRGARQQMTGKPNVKDTRGQENKRPRKLRSGATALKAKARQKSAAQKAASDRARQTGKVKDVASTLLRPKG